MGMYEYIIILGHVSQSCPLFVTLAGFTFICRV